MYSVIKCLLVLVLTAVCAAQPSFAASPRYVEGEAIVMLRQGISAGTAGASAKSVANGAADAASELGAVVVHNFLPVKAAADSENSVNCGARRGRFQRTAMSAAARLTRSHSCAARAGRTRRNLSQGCARTLT